MAVKAKAAKKNPSAVALGRKGGKRGGPARAAKLTPDQRSESARKAVQARWAKSKGAAVDSSVPAASTIEASDKAVLTLLKRLKSTNDPAEIRQLSDQLERAIFHKQYANT